MSQKLIFKSTAKITKQEKTKKLSVIKKDLEKNFIYLASGESSVIASINSRYNHSNGKSAIPVINKIGESSFNYNQVQLLKKYKGEFDSKLGYWFLSL
jgi:hypothetical protein